MRFRIGYTVPIPQIPVGILPVNMRTVAMFVSLLALCNHSIARAEKAPIAHVTDPRASFIDIQQRRRELHSATNPRVQAALSAVRSCQTMEPVEPPLGRINIPRRYVSGGHGEIDPRESELSQPYYHLQNLAANGANSYLVTGDHKEAQCVLDALDRWAVAGTLHNYDADKDSQAWDRWGGQWHHFLSPSP